MAPASEVKAAVQNAMGLMRLFLTFLPPIAPFLRPILVSSGRRSNRSGALMHRVLLLSFMLVSVTATAQEPRLKKRRSIKKS